MSELRVEKYNILSANMGGISSLPPISTKLSLNDISNNFTIDENDGLFVNYGIEECVYPYRYQDLYDRKLEPKQYNSVVLENENLRALFLPDFGGKLWSLIDKNSGKELLFKNDVVRPCNLGVRNAWTSGGIEWNSCFKGHNPFTCSLINTATTQLDDGTPVLRFFYFERIRSVVVQMDFFLPDKSKLLYSRVRITNPNSKVIPMYWWSNVAVVEKQGDRVIVPAVKSYTINSKYDVIKIEVPVFNGIDVTYPTKNITSNDFFWTTKGCSDRHYIAQLDREGFGLCETSTSLLKGRKLFVWGNSQGGHKWMNFLTEDDKSGRYDEIQCGLAHTQYESLPMPPHTVWEWIEGYGAMQANKQKIHGDWKLAREEVESIFDNWISTKELEQLLISTRGMAKKPAKMLFYADGWASLELKRREKENSNLMCCHLDFKEVDNEQKDWINLLENETIGVHNINDIPLSYMRQKEWIEMLEKSILNKDKKNWYAYYLLATYYIAEEKFNLAEKYLKTSLKLKKSAWANYSYAILSKKLSDRKNEVKYMLKAFYMRKDDISIAKEVFRCLFENKRSKETIALFNKSNCEIKDNKRCQLYFAYALARIGELDRAEEILCGKDKKTFLVVPDVRECELTVTQLWVYINEQRGLTREQMGEPPRDLDFRMFSEREGWI